MTINWKKRAPPPKLHQEHSKEDALRIRGLINNLKRKLVDSHPDSSMSRFTSHYEHDDCDQCIAASVVTFKDQVLWTSDAYCEKHLLDQLAKYYK